MAPTAVDLSMPYGWSNATVGHSCAPWDTERWVCVRMTTRKDNDALYTMLYMDLEDLLKNGIDVRSYMDDVRNGIDVIDPEMLEAVIPYVSDVMRDGAGELRQKIRRIVSEETWDLPIVGENNEQEASQESEACGRDAVGVGGSPQ